MAKAVVAAAVEEARQPSAPRGAYSLVGASSDRQLRCKASSVAEAPRGGSGVSGVSYIGQRDQTEMTKSHDLRSSSAAALRQSARFYGEKCIELCLKCRRVLLYSSRPKSIQKVANFSYRLPAPALSGPGIKIGGQNLKVSYVIPDSSEHMSTHTAPVDDPLGLVFVRSLF